MSGGEFQYNQYKLIQIADDIEQIIIDNDSTELNLFGDKKGSFYSEETINEFKTAVNLLRQAYVYVQRIDWLVSCDDGEDTFHQRLKDELKNE